jgi:hypothetical protein
MIPTSELDVKIGDIYYADSSYDRVSPRFYKVTKITKYYVFFEPMNGLYVNPNRSELKYGSNSPAYYVIPLPEDMDAFCMDNDIGFLELSFPANNRVNKNAFPFFFVDENGGYRVDVNYHHDEFRSKIYKVLGEDMVLSEPGKYGGLLTKYSEGVAIYGCFD